MREAYGSVGRREGHMPTLTRVANDAKWPVLVEGSGGEDVCEWITRERSQLDALLLEHGAVLFRNFGVHDEERFQAVARSAHPELLDYVYRSTPRTSVGAGVFTATEYSASETIPQHCENAYQRDWPMRLMFCCTQPATDGGETPLADSRRVTKRLGGKIMETFAAKGVTYVRNYREGVDVPWNVVFQTEERAGVEDYCRRNGIEWEWLEDDVLRTRQRCQGVATHPITGAELFFNQAHLFHVSALDPDMREALVDLYGEEGVPRNALLGDGTPLDALTLEAIREAYRAETVSFSWRRGDFLIVDNMLVSHGRTPFRGARKVLVAMALPHSQVRQS
jgi:alpha-ketoglutarate-dependent taurine dioxygenase